MEIGILVAISPSAHLVYRGNDDADGAVTMRSAANAACRRDVELSDHDPAIRNDV